MALNAVYETLFTGVFLFHTLLVSPRKTGIELERFYCITKTSTLPHSSLTSKDQKAKNVNSLIPMLFDPSHINPELIIMSQEPVFLLQVQHPDSKQTSFIKCN